MSVEIRVGTDSGRRALMASVRARGIPILVSANCLWDAKRQHFRRTRVFEGLDVALDSGGFVAMKKYGGYRWAAAQYVGLAGWLRPTWWAQMDFCCEPEIAGDVATVKERIGRTVSGLRECQAIAAGEGVAAPMPVLQGWTPEDYCQGPIWEQEYQWPKLVGIGSVCRRDVNGPAGVLRVVEALNERLPAGVLLHLFGVKSQAIAVLAREFPERVKSMDSQAYSYRARCAAREQGIACSNEFRAQAMDRWYSRQLEAVSASARQLELGL